MKVRVLSDLHLEFSEGKLDIPEGDVLVLAGDICVAEDIGLYEDFFKQCVEKYNKVFYVMGNHENYGGVFEDTFWILQEHLPREISILNNRSECYEGVHFIGATMWTNMNGMNLNTMRDAQECMNDYHTVVKKDGKLLSPLDTVEEHLFTREWFHQAIPTLNGDVFVITHHSPSESSVRGRYEHMKHAYSNTMENFILSHPNITHWCHGHIHHSNDYMIGDCRVISNPRGYYGHEENPDFNLNHEIEV